MKSLGAESSDHVTNDVIVGISEHYQDVISRFRASVDNMVWAYDAVSICLSQEPNGHIPTSCSSNMEDQRMKRKRGFVRFYITR